MNGRIYDPLISRFLSPDNYVQAPSFTQSFNRYSYAFNNPLLFTDISGMWSGIDIDIEPYSNLDLGRREAGGKGYNSFYDRFPNPTNKYLNRKYNIIESYIRSNDLRDFNRNDINAYILVVMEINGGTLYVDTDAEVYWIFLDEVYCVYNPQGDSYTENNSGYEGYENSVETDEYHRNNKSRGSGGGNNSDSDSEIDLKKIEPILKLIKLNRGIPEFESSLLNRKQAAVTPGFFVIYSTGGSEDPFYNTHEPGHALQYLILGPNYYYSLVAIPSLITASFFSQEIHSKMPYETSANLLWYWYSGESDESNRLYLILNKTK